MSRRAQGEVNCQLRPEGKEVSRERGRKACRKKTLEYELGGKVGKQGNC